MNPPIATYRVQFRQGMTFDRAIENLPHIRDLGISHVYASPIFTATSGSTHGYDVTDANEIDPDIGGRGGFDRFAAALKRHGLGLILDIVPNHMAASEENGWWRDVMEKGQGSTFADYFDIDWREPLTLPHLGENFAEVVAAGTFHIENQDGAWSLRYYEARYPLSADSTDWLVEETGGNPGSLTALSRSPEKMADLHDRQHWRLIHWKEAARHLSYRRFFEVTGLVGLRVEDPHVFEASHSLILDLVKSGAVQGLRIDHVDGLADPAGYLRQLRQAVGEDIFIVVEKILGPGEVLRPDWPVSGTTGYEFIEAASHLFIDRVGLDKLDVHYRSMVPSLGTFEEELRRAKADMASRNFEGEVSRLAGIAASLLPDAAPEVLASAIRALLVSFPVYRTYGTSKGLAPTDMAVLDDVIAKAKAHADAPDAIDAVAGLLRRESPEAAEFRTRFQQLTGPIMAKSMEDTLFYRFNRLIGANEVGGEPDTAPGGPAAFHAAMIERLSTQPNGLTGTTTHDTKRGEDARARLYVISEDADGWASHVTRWRQMNAALIEPLSGGPAPDANTEWMLYQALLGVISDEPGEELHEQSLILHDRFRDYALKAIREAKTRTDWGVPDAAYENAVTQFASALVSEEGNAFLADFRATTRPYIACGRINSLTQTLIKIMAPGVPDFYQGAEGFDLSLVDPDNRRAIDYARLRDIDEAKQGALEQKLAVIKAGLGLRHDNLALFSKGEYLPISATGERADHVIAFARRWGSDHAIAVAPRLMVAALRPEEPFVASDFWGDTRLVLPASLSGPKRDLISGREHAEGDLFLPAILSPVALLIRA
jgi:(1->4)-alpha-D-glucan 1-alpha-D-glucosylmutase